MAPVTRSMTKIIFQRDCVYASFKVDVLSTPGIAINIAQHLSTNDEDLKSMFRLINDKRYRHELMVLCNPIKKKYEINLAEIISKMEVCYIKNQKRIEKELRKTIEEYLDAHVLIKEYEESKLSIFTIYEYLCSVSRDLHLLGPKFAITVYQKFYQLMYEFESDLEATNKMYEFENRLHEYLQIGFNTLHTEEEYYNSIDQHEFQYD